MVLYLRIKASEIVMNESNLTKEKLIEYIKKNTVADLSEFNSNTLLFRDGIFDSMAFVLLIDYLEENFGIKPSDEDLIEDNFESVEAITRYILQKKELSATGWICSFRHFLCVELPVYLTVQVY